MSLEISKLLFGIAGLLLGAVIGYFGTRHSAATNLQIAQEKLEAENRLSNAATAAIKLLLLQPEWELRSFDAIRWHIRGFKNDELRRLLLASGAVAFQQEESKRELWGLLERNAARLKPVGDLGALKTLLPAPADGPSPRIRTVAPALTPKTS